MTRDNSILELGSNPRTRVALGTGRTKVIVPIIAANASALIAQVAALDSVRPAAAPATADVVEWRIDHFENALDENAVLAAATELRAATDLPILATFRTEEEGAPRQPNLPPTPIYWWRWRKAAISMPWTCKCSSTRGR